MASAAKLEVVAAFNEQTTSKVPNGIVLLRWLVHQMK